VPGLDRGVKFEGWMDAGRLFGKWASLFTARPESDGERWFLELDGKALGRLLPLAEVFAPGAVYNKPERRSNHSQESPEGRPNVFDDRCRDWREHRWISMPALDLNTTA